MARTEATLTCLMIAQDFLIEHWSWTDIEKQCLGDIKKMGMVIKSRLENGGCEIAEMYAIKHDKDEKKMWDEVNECYKHDYTSNHGHFLIRFAEGKGKTLAELAPMIGVEPQFIEKPKRGRYAYDNLLSYMTHIKYAEKYQYPVTDVITLAGRDYVEYYRERHEAWRKGRAVRATKNAKELKEFINGELREGRLTINDIILNEEWTTAYILYKEEFEKTIARRQDLLKQRKYLQEHPDRV